MPLHKYFCYTYEYRPDGKPYDLCGNRLKKQGYHYALTAEKTPESVIDDEESCCYVLSFSIIKDTCIVSVGHDVGILFA